MTDPRRAFEELLKTSHFFNDAINSHRRATADVIAGLCEFMVETDLATQAQLLAKLRSMEDQRHPGDISDAVGRRALCQLIRDRLGAR